MDNLGYVEGVDEFIRFVDVLKLQKDSGILSVKRVIEFFLFQQLVWGSQEFEVVRGLCIDFILIGIFWFVLVYCGNIGLFGREG